MSRTLVLLWLGSAGAQAAHQAELDSWAQARWVQLAPPAADAPAGIAYDDALGQKLEELLDQARLAASSLDDATARERLTEIDGLLRRYPALPQAAWLMAEALHIEASVAARSSPAARPGLLERAAILEGRRAPPFGEPASEPTDPGVVTVTLSGARATERVYVDGERVSPRWTVRAGEHHFRVVRRERVVWAGWVSVERSGELALPIPPPVPCSLDDLDGVRLHGSRVLTAPSTACAAWAVARPARDGVEIASCRGSSCGPLMTWKRHHGVVYSGPPQPPAPPGFPAWATWALVGAGTAVVAGAVLWRAGAFDEPAPGGRRFEFWGPAQRASGLSPSAPAPR